MNLQKSFKIKLSFIVALALAFAVAISAFFGVTFARADRKVTVNGTSIFVTTENAKVYAHKDEEDFYTMFAFTDDADAVNFRKDLAYKWFENEEQDIDTSDEEDEEEPVTEPSPDVNFSMHEGWFNMEIGFADENNMDGNIQFEKFVITFESQQYTQTKDGKTTNYIVFEKTADNKLNVYVVTKDAADKDLDAVLNRLSEADSLGTVENDKISINFTDYENGNYTVKISDGTTTCTGAFENVGKTFSKYSSSTTTPVTPLVFKAIFAEEDENDTETHGNAFMTLYSLNNQSFKLDGVTETNTPYSGGTVNDTTPPVLCLNSEVPFIKYNGEITFDYTVIDVLTSSPSLTTSYFMLTTAYAESGKAPVYNEDGGDYRVVTDADDQYMFPLSIHYAPQTGDYKSSVYDENFEVKAAVKVVLKLTDTTSTGGQTTYVLLDWYVNEDYLLQIGDTGAKVPYIAVATDKQGLAYAYTSYDETEEKWVSDPDNSTAWLKAVEEYKEAVAEAAKDLMAGSKNYFYLPSAENLFKDNATAYSDLTFSIYYNNGSQQSSTGKSANALSINLTKAGKYVFTIYATDAAGNNMFYADENGETVEFAASEIWSMYNQEKDTDYEDMKKYLPWFEFTVQESEISIEDPDEQSIAYVGSSFTADSFEINGVSVNTVYTLYEFQNELWAKENGGEAMSYADFIDNKDTFIQEYRIYLKRIRPTTELKAGTADYEAFNGYGWNGTSLTFTPQTANTCYIIKCEARSSETAEPVTSYMVIAAAPKVAALKGEDTWVQDNVTSIILLCIAGASLIGIILLLVIKPKNSGDVDEVIITKKKNKK